MWEEGALLSILWEYLRITLNFQPTIWPNSYFPSLYLRNSPSALSLSLYKNLQEQMEISQALSLSTGCLKVMDHFEFRIGGLWGGWFWSSSDSDLHGRGGRERETHGIWVYEAWDSDLELVWFEFELDKIEGLGGDGLFFLSPTTIDVTIRRLDCREWKVGPFGWVGRDEVDMGLSFFRVKWRVCF